MGTKWVELLKEIKPSVTNIGLLFNPAMAPYVINMKTAKALGLTVPNSMQLLADEVIE